MNEEEKSVESNGDSFEAMGFDSGFLNSTPEADNEKEIVGSETEQDNPDEKESSKEVEKENKPPSSETKDDSSLVNVLVEDLYEKGAISTYDKDEFSKIIAEKGEAEAARYIFTSELDSIKENTKKLYDGEFQEFTRLREAGYSPEQASQNVSAKGQLDAITDEAFIGEQSEELIKNLMTAQLQRTTQMGIEQIEEFVQYKLDTAEDNGIAEGKKALGLLKEKAAQDEKDFIKSQEEDSINQKKALEDRKADLRKSIDNTKEFIKDTPINDKIKDRMYSMITDPVAEIDGNPVNELTRLRAEDPKGFEMKMAYLAATGYFSSKDPWSQVANAAQTKASSKLENFLDNQSDVSYNTHKINYSANNKKHQGNPFDAFLDK